MPSDTKVAVYYGPLSWFQDQMEKKKRVSLLDIIYERDEANRRHTHVVQGHEAPPEKPALRPKGVVAESSDFASLNEHAITNFAGLIRSINPKQLHLHNPPAHIHWQLERSFKTEIERYEYPVVTRETLVRFRDGFAEHLVGQAAVKAPYGVAARRGDSIARWLLELVWELAAAALVHTRAADY